MITENGGATTRQKQQRKRRNRKGRDKKKSGEQGVNGESSTVAVADKNRKMVPVATKNTSSVSGASDSNGPITIRISNPGVGKDITFKVKQTTKMKKYFASYASTKSIRSHASLRFTTGGKDIQPDDTPEILGLKENDVIQCSDSHVMVIGTRQPLILLTVRPGKLGLTVKMSKPSGPGGALITGIDYSSCTFANQVEIGDRLVTIDGSPITHCSELFVNNTKERVIGIVKFPIQKTIQELGFSPNVDFPHLRPDCGVHPFTSSTTNNADNFKCCPNCFCLVCDDYANNCKEWDNNTSNPTVGPHCHAHEKDTKWINLVKARVKATRDAAANSTAATTYQLPPHNPNQRQYHQQQHSSTTDTLDANVLEKRDDAEAVANVLLKNNDACSIVFEDECLMSNILHFEGSWLTGTASGTIGLVCKSWNSFAIGKKGGKALAIILDEQDKKLIDIAKEVMKDESMSWSARILAMAIADDRVGLSNAFDDEDDSSQGIGAAFEEAIECEDPGRYLEVVCPRGHPFHQCCRTIHVFHQNSSEDFDDIDSWRILFVSNIALAAAKVGSRSAIRFLEEEHGGNEYMLWASSIGHNGHSNSFISHLVTYACRFPTLQGPVESIGEVFPESDLDPYFYDHETANNLHLAASRGHNDLVRALLRAGMDPNEKCWIYTLSEPHHLHKLRTPADWAEAKVHTELAQLLRRAQGVYGEEAYGTFLHCHVGGGSATGLTNTTFKVDW
jgi:hypothetical protein